jgi:hypothetical protein
MLCCKSRTRYRIIKTQEELNYKKLTSRLMTVWTYRKMFYCTYFSYTSAVSPKKVREEPLLECVLYLYFRLVQSLRTRLAFRMVYISLHLGPCVLLSLFCLFDNVCYVRIIPRSKLNEFSQGKPSSILCLPKINRGQ